MSKISYNDLKTDRRALNVIAITIFNNFDEYLKDAGLHNQAKIASEFGINPSQLSIIVTTIKAIKFNNYEV